MLFIRSNLVSPTFKPSLYRWLAATIVATIAVSYTIIPLTAFMTGKFPTFEDVEFMFMTVPKLVYLDLPLTLPTLVIFALITYVLFRRKSITSLGAYIMIGTLIAIFEWLLMTQELDILFIFVGIINGAPPAMVFWLIVWWPGIKAPINNTQ